MIYKSTQVKVADNSGGVIAEVIHVYAGNMQDFTSVAGFVRVSLKKVLPNNKVKKGDKYKAVVIRAKKNVQRKDGSSFKFSENAVVLLNDKWEVIFTRVFGPVPSELRKFPNCLKIVSLATEVI